MRKSTNAATVNNLINFISFSHLSVYDKGAFVKFVGGKDF